MVSYNDTACTLAMGIMYNLMQAYPYTDIDRSQKLPLVKWKP